MELEKNLSPNEPERGLERYFRGFKPTCDDGRLEQDRQAQVEQLRMALG